MSTVSVAVRGFLKQDDGLETIEYAVMTAMIASVVVIALGALMLAIGDLFGEVAAVL